MIACEHLLKAKAALEAARETEGPAQYALLTIAQVQCLASIADSLLAGRPPAPPPDPRATGGYA